MKFEPIRALRRSVPVPAMNPAIPFTGLTSRQWLILVVTVIVSFLLLTWASDATVWLTFGSGLLVCYQQRTSRPANCRNRFLDRMFFPAFPLVSSLAIGLSLYRLFHLTL